MFQVLIGILTILNICEYPLSSYLFQVLIGILTICFEEFPLICFRKFQVLIGILTIFPFESLVYCEMIVSSPYRYSNNMVKSMREGTQGGKFQVLIGILTM